MTAERRARRRCVPLVLVLVALAALAPTAAGKRPRLRCGDGVTLFVEGRLRIFAVRYRTSLEQGYDHYACLGGRGRPQHVGLEGFDGGAGSWDAPAYAFAGGRYLGSYHWTDGEGGPSASFSVVDLEKRETLSSTNATFESGVPGFRVASDGSMVLTDEDQIELMSPGSRRVRTLSTPRVRASDLALAGGTVYWTEHPDGAPAVARSATLPGVGGDAEARVLEPITPRPHGRGCRAARGRTIASSPTVRVYQRAGVRRACRIGGRSVRVPAGAPAPRVAGDRWLLALGPGSPPATARVIDTRSGRTVTRVAAGDRGIRRATLLPDGSLAWLETGGRLLARRPGSAAPAELAPAEPAPSALAASRRLVYWTAGGAPHAARPPG